MALIRTIAANCRDCYKCVRHCPMKAIRVAGAHAEVIQDLCIGCGTCVRICPQGAKQVRQSQADVLDLLGKGKPVVASVAPSYTSSFEGVSPDSLASALHQLGFTHIAETAQAANYVAHRTVEAAAECQSPALGTSCPVVVNLVERYYPELIGHLVPVASPMAAHGRMLKSALGPEARVVFIGPCIAKKDEILRDGIQGSVDAVLTFSELKAMFRDAGIDPAGGADLGDGASTDSAWDFPAIGASRLFPIEGGLAATAGLSADGVGRHDLSVTGIEQCISFLDSMASGRHADVRLVDMLACAGGCISGPCAETDLDMWTRREKVMDHAERHEGSAALRSEHAQLHVEPKMLTASFVRRDVKRTQPSEEQIRAVLAKTDKLTPADELNCGACGYNSCRDKAIAVIHGLAEVEMCIPHMRARAESLSNLIIASIPNGIVVVDRDFKIISANQAFESVFRVNAAECLGSDVSCVMDPEPFRRVLDSREPQRVEESHLGGQLITVQDVFYVEVRDVAVAIVDDVTSERARARAIQNAREDTLEKAGKVIERQMRVAQEIAGLLGETTAETKLLLTQLMKQIQNEELT